MRKGEAMAIFKRGNIYWYNFVFNGVHIQESSKQRNPRVARNIEAAHRTALAKGEVGIRERKPVPTLKDFASRFEGTIETQCAEKPRTIQFYKAKMRLILADKALAGARLDTIDEAAIDAYVKRRLKTKSRRKRDLSAASVNRELATLRRLLRLAHEWRVIDRVPRIRLLRGEHQREFVLTQEQEKLYLATVPHRLGDVAVVLLDCGLRLGEALSLEWQQVHLEPANGATFGYLTVLSGKAKSKKSRNVPLSERVVEVLKRWGPARGYVFHRDDGKPLSETWTDQQHAAARDLLKLPEEFVLHCLRHTFGTRLGESGADVFTIMKLMGHSTVLVSQRYVHPSPESIERAYERFTKLNRRPVTTISTTPEPFVAAVFQQVV